MLHKETIEPATLELLIRLMNDRMLKDFVLVGGTALALQLGHRISIDLDLFSETSFDQSSLADYLYHAYSFELDFISTNTIKGEINGVQVDCIAHQYPWIENYCSEDHIRMAGFSDIAAMKLNAVAGNGTRLKDFIDIAFLSYKMTFNNMLDSYVMKYKGNPVIPLKAITYFEDLNFNEPIRMTGEKSFDWAKIRKRLHKIQEYPDQLFPALS